MAALLPDSPLVTVVIPMRNEARGIAACLESVLANRLPGDAAWELLVLDGDSSDGSAAIVDAMAERDPRVRRIANPKRLQAPAFNLGLAAAQGRYLVRMDAHSIYDPDYLAESVRLLEETGAGNVGGVQRAAGTSWFGRAVAAAVSSRFAAGDAAYRNATTAQWTDTVYLGAWRTETLRTLGGMREDWAVNEDYEMNVRLRATGARVYLSPTIRSTYFVRSSLPKLVRQYLRYGYWKVRTLVKHPGSLRWRQLVAPTFVISLLLTPLTVGRFGPLGAAHLALYLAANLAASAATAAQAGWQYFPMLPLIFLTIHCSWGSGFLLGCLVWPFRRHD